MHPGILEEKSLWYQYKTQVWLDETSEESAAIHNIMRALRSVRNSGRLAYVTVPITSGEIFYVAKQEKPDEPEERLLDWVMRENYNLGWTFAADVVRRQNCPVIYPADLIPARQRWTQAHFQALWLSIIGEKVTELHQSRGWTLSNGGVEEFVHVMQLKLGLPQHRDLVFFNTKEAEETERERMRNIVVYDRGGRVVSLHDGLVAIQKARTWLVEQGFEAKRLERSERLLEWTGEMIERGYYQ